MGPGTYKKAGTVPVLDALDTLGCAFMERDNGIETHMRGVVIRSGNHRDVKETAGSFERDSGRHFTFAPTLRMSWCH